MSDQIHLLLVYFPYGNHNLQSKPHLVSFQQFNQTDSNFV